MKKLSILFVIAFILVACSTKTNTPTEIMDEEIMDEPAVSEETNALYFEVNETTDLFLEADINSRKIGFLETGDCFEALDTYEDDVTWLKISDSAWVILNDALETINSLDDYPIENYYLQWPHPVEINWSTLWYTNDSLVEADPTGFGVYCFDSDFIYDLNDELVSYSMWDAHVYVNSTYTSLMFMQNLYWYGERVINHFDELGRISLQVLPDDMGYDGAAYQKYLYDEEGNVVETRYYWIGGEILENVDNNDAVDITYYEYENKKISKVTKDHSYYNTYTYNGNLSFYYNSNSVLCSISKFDNCGRMIKDYDIWDQIDVRSVKY